jgi:hypothetical protein
MLNRRSFFTALIGAPAAKPVPKPALQSRLEAAYNCPRCGLAVLYRGRRGETQVMSCCNRSCPLYMVPFAIPTVPLRVADPETVREVLAMEAEEERQRLQDLQWGSRQLELLRELSRLRPLPVEKINRQYDRSFGVAGAPFPNVPPRI